MAVASDPAATPTAPPITASKMASARNWVRMCPLVAPSARRSPISERRSRTEMTMMLATLFRPAAQLLGEQLGGALVGGAGAVRVHPQRHGAAAAVPEPLGRSPQVDAGAWPSRTWIPGVLP